MKAVKRAGRISRPRVSSCGGCGQYLLVVVTALLACPAATATRIPLGLALDRGLVVQWLDDAGTPTECVMNMASRPRQLRITPADGGGAVRHALPARQAVCEPRPLLAQDQLLRYQVDDQRLGSLRSGVTAGREIPDGGVVSTTGPNGSCNLSMLSLIQPAVILPAGRQQQLTVKLSATVNGGHLVLQQAPAAKLPPLPIVRAESNDLDIRRVDENRYAAALPGHTPEAGQDRMLTITVDTPTPGHAGMYVIGGYLETPSGARQCWLRGLVVAGRE